MTPEQSHEARVILRLSGDGVREFLQGLVTCDVKALARGACYGALLTPQGKYISDFFLIPEGDDVLVDLPEVYAETIRQKLTLYKLRAKITITVTDYGVERGLGEVPEGAFQDPRMAALGWRRYGTGCATPPDMALRLETLRVALGVPAAGLELIPGETYILEAGFEELNGVDFRKGCYVGQEIVARMKHKIERRKGLRRVEVSGDAPVGAEIIRDGKPCGTLYSHVDGRGIAQLRFDRMGPGMRAGDADVRMIEDA